MCSLPALTSSSIAILDTIDTVGFLLSGLDHLPLELVLLGYLSIVELKSLLRDQFFSGISSCIFVGDFPLWY